MATCKLGMEHEQFQNKDFKNQLKKEELQNLSSLYFCGHK
jgi:hypothetical protein